jgi:glutamate-ammonia-ligase adenylyltransferase
LVEACLTLAADQTGIPADDFCVIAMGKLGGAELNYSSDIDLLFICGNAPARLRQLGQRLIDNLTRMTEEGFLYRVDMRLRPWGSTGELVSSMDGYLGYLQKHARLWEKQALLKARVIAGNHPLGANFLRQTQAYLFDAPADVVRQEIHSVKQRIEARLKQKGQEFGQVKLGQGSIRDIEFVTQYLQLANGKKFTRVQSSNTLEALAKLYSQRLLTTDEYRILTGGYTFLRTVEHYLQLMHYQQTHLLPDHQNDLNHLARRLGFEGKSAGQRLIAQYQQHTAVVRLIYDEHLGDAPALEGQKSRARSSTLIPHLAHMPASYLNTFSQTEIQHHAALIETLDAQRPVRVEAQAIGGNRWRVTVVGFDFQGELSLICGLLFVYGFNIIDGSIFSYDLNNSAATPLPPQPRFRNHRSTRRLTDVLPSQKIVDTFTISTEHDLDQECWDSYERDLSMLVQQLRVGKAEEAHGELAKRVAATLLPARPERPRLYAVAIEIDNEASRHFTAMYIDAPDTTGFLYELTSALALTGINIGRVTVETIGDRVRDTLYVIDRNNQKIVGEEAQLELRVATVLIKHFTHLLPRSPNPESALLHFRDFVRQLFTRPNWPEELASLERPDVLTTLARLLGVSDFLWQDFLKMQHENLFPILHNVEALQEHKSKSDLRAELVVLLNQMPPGPEQRRTLNAFKDREMFRIDMRQIQGHIPEFSQFSGELSDLAEVVIEEAVRLAAREVRALYGLPKLDNRHDCTLSICALGKAGGRELGFASDMELMFVYAGNGRTTGPRVITNAEYYDRLVSLADQMIETKREGMFELDLQLRPYGKAGSLGVSLEAFSRYFAPNGDAWPYERQALVKLRPIAGDVKLGQEIVKLRDQFVYTGQPFDVAAMRAMRERQLRHSVKAGTINAKLSPGGLVDIEYLVQGLQITHGHQYLQLRMTNTQEALKVLAVTGIVSDKDFVQLSEALNFFHALISALRMVRNDAKALSVPPVESEEFAFLARRMRYEAKDQLRQDLGNHTTRVLEINTRLLG